MTIVHQNLAICANVLMSLVGNDTNLIILDAFLELVAVEKP